MTKFPLSKAITTTFAYLTEEFFTWVKILWLPVLMLQAALTAIMPRYMNVTMQMLELGDDPPTDAVLPLMGSFFTWIGVMLLVSLVIYAIIFGGVLRHISRGEKPTAPFYLQFGADETRILATMLLGGLVIGIAYIGGAIAFAAAATVLGAALGILGGLIAFFLFFGFLGGIAWLCVRLSLAFPAAVAEQRIGLAPSWAATKGNFWSLSAYWLLFFIVIMFFASAYSMVVMPDYFSNIGEMIAAGDDEAEVNRINLEIIKQSMAMYDISNPRFLLTGIATYLYSFALFGVMSAATGVAYWLLTDARAREA